MSRKTLAVGAGAALALLLLIVTVADAHDMFLRPVRYYVEPNAVTLVRVLNGTFSKSENSIARSRLADIAVAGPQGRTRLDTALWGVKGDTSTFELRAAAPGTYVLGASTKASQIALQAKDFNSYLKEEGILDVLAARGRDGEMERPARERYSKHVKALVQVGSVRSPSAMLPLGYPAEVVPTSNPYNLRIGDSLSVRALVEGKPVAGQMVLYGGRQLSGSNIAEKETRTDANGMVRFKVASAGVWYVKFVNMARVTGDSVDYESRWATLTFQVR
ncbi:MAG TPA: DUF4198 domain-containing protein [Gemmatimonadaceae bacterium]